MNGANKTSVRDATGSGALKAALEALFANTTDKLSAEAGQELLTEFGYAVVPDAVVYVSNLSIVLTCVCAANGEKVVLKHSPKKSIASARTEVRVLLTLRGQRHVPAVRQVFGILLPDDTVVTAWYPTCFYDAIASAVVSASLAWQVVLAIAQTYVAAHRAGITHVDLKPENVFINDAGVVVVGDWNSACCSEQERLLRRNSAMCTPVYAPHHRGSQTDQAADLFRIGALMYTVLYSRPPVPAMPVPGGSTVRKFSWYSSKSYVQPLRHDEQFREVAEGLMEHTDAWTLSDIIWRCEHALGGLPVVSSSPLPPPTRTRVGTGTPAGLVGDADRPFLHQASTYPFEQQGPGADPKVNLRRAQSM